MGHKMKSKIIFALFAVAASWGDPFFYPENQDMVTPTNNWRMRKRQLSHPLFSPLWKKSWLPPLFGPKMTRCGSMAHPFYDQAKFFKRSEDENPIKEEEMEDFLNKLVAIELAKEP